MEGKFRTQDFPARVAEATAEQPNAACLRVAAYIRVSSEHESQEDSYALQERYFTGLLAQNPSWVSAGIYSDYGISATSDRHRVGFQRLLRHCKEGKLDRIIVKSISRFARNTVDFLEAMNRLKECGVTILFEKEALDSADELSEFVLTTLAAIAQEESRAISSNIRWGQQVRFPRGDTANFAIYGYRFAEGDDALETTASGYRRRRVAVVAEEAPVVRRIFAEAASGAQPRDIARGLNRDNVPAPPPRRIKTRRLKEELDEGWTGARIGQMIRNERYCGDAIAQKTYTEDYLSHKAKVNRGERPQYYIKNHHPAIVGRTLYEEAQSKGKGGGRTPNRYPLSGQLLCPHCGRVFNVRNTGHNAIWFCPSTARNNGKVICRNDPLYEEQVVNAVKKGLWERFSRSFVADIRARLEHLQGSDYNESDRAMMQRRAQILFLERSNAERKKKLAQARLGTQQVRADVFGDGLEEAEALAKELAACDKRLAAIAEKEAALSAEAEHKERYWKMLEENYKWRADAIQWMKTLPDGRDGIDAFIEGLTAAYVKAFILSITVHNAKRFTIRWFDDVSSDVELYDVVKDHRFGHDYF